MQRKRRLAAIQEEQSSEIDEELAHDFHEELAKEFQELIIAGAIRDKAKEIQESALTSASEVQEPEFLLIQENVLTTVIQETMKQNQEEEASALEINIEEFSNMCTEYPEVLRFQKEIEEEEDSSTSNQNPEDSKLIQKIFRDLVPVSINKEIITKKEEKISSKSGPDEVCFSNKDTGETFRVTEQIGESPDEGIAVYRGYFFVKENESYERMAFQEFFVAIKLVNIDQEPRKYWTLEAKVKKNSLVPDHANIIGVKKWFVTEKINYWVVFACMDPGPLRSVTSSTFTHGLPEKCVIVALGETLKGLSVIHENGQVHRELSAGQIFLNRAPEIRISFSATIYRHGSTSREKPSSSSTLLMDDIHKWAAAPEVYDSENNQYTAKADIWLIGITALELAYGAIQVESREDLVSIIEKINKKKKLPKKIEQEVYQKGKNSVSSVKGLLIPSCSCIPQGPFKKNRFSKEFETMVAKCLDLDPGKRPTAAELLRDKVFVESMSVFYFERELIKGGYNKYS